MGEKSCEKSSSRTRFALARIRHKVLAVNLVLKVILIHSLLFTIAISTLPTQYDGPTAAYSCCVMLQSNASR